MDPRLQNPVQPPHQVSVADASPQASPQHLSASPAPASPSTSARPQTPAPPQHQAQQPIVPPPTYQIVGQIPLAQPGGGAAPMPSAPLTQPPTQEGDELDRILQAVNNRVQAPTQPAPRKSKQLAAKLAAKAPKPKLPGTSKPVGAILAAVLVFVILSACAVIAYRGSGKSAALSGKNGTVGTSYQSASSIQTAGGTLVRPADLDNYSQDLQTKLNDLNDSGDFDPNSLSSAVLGL